MRIWAALLFALFLPVSAFAAEADLYCYNAGQTPAFQPCIFTNGGNAAFRGGTSTGTANAQVVATTLGNFALKAGNMVVFVAGFTNTGAVTLAVDGTTATAVRLKSFGGLTALTGNEIVVGEAYEAAYDGTYYQLMGPQGEGGTPTVGSNACGAVSQGTVTAGGTDYDHVLTVGTTGVTACAVTFGQAFLSAPICFFTPANATAAAQGTTAAYISAQSTSGYTITGSALAGAAYNVLCVP